MKPLRLFWVAAAFTLFWAITSCGGGGETGDEAVEPEATLAPQAGTTPASAPAPTVAPASAAQPSTAISILETALKPAPFELENVRYGGTFKTAEGNVGVPLDPKLVTNLAREAWALQKPVEWTANPNDVFVHLEPFLAESWKASSDLKTYTFAIRKGVKWHDVAPVNGRELVADDIVFNVDRFREPDSLKAFLYSQVESAQAPDKYTLVLRLKEPNAWVMNDLFGGSEFIVPRELVQEAGGALTAKLIGTGPYILQSHKPRQGAIYVRNPSYWGKDAKGNQLPYTDEIHTFYMTDFATVIAAYRTGQVDYGGSLTPEQQATLAKDIPGLRLYTVGSSPANGLSFNTKKAPWNDVRVRRAVNMSLDKERLTNAITGTKWEWGTPFPWSLVSDEPFTFEKLGPYYKYNPTEAKKLLIEAGFPDGKLRVGSPLDFIQPAQAPLMQVLQQLYKENGIEFDLAPLDPPTYYAKWYQRAHRDLGWTFQNTGDVSLHFYAQNKFSPSATQNTAFIDDLEVNRVVKEIKTTTDPAKLREHARFLWDFDTLGSWNIWRPGELSYSIGSPRLRNYTARLADVFALHRILPWLADAPRTAP